MASNLPIRAEMTLGGCTVLTSCQDMGLPDFATVWAAVRAEAVDTDRRAGMSALNGMSNAITVGDGGTWTVGVKEDRSRRVSVDVDEDADVNADVDVDVDVEACRSTRTFGNAARYSRRLGFVIGNISRLGLG